jgi:hypothetical protein
MMWNHTRTPAVMMLNLLYRGSLEKVATLLICEY